MCDFYCSQIFGNIIYRFIRLISGQINRYQLVHCFAIWLICIQHTINTSKNQDTHTTKGPNSYSLWEMCMLQYLAKTGSLYCMYLNSHLCEYLLVFWDLSIKLSSLFFSCFLSCFPPLKARPFRILDLSPWQPVAGVLQSEPWCLVLIHSVQHT